MTQQLNDTPETIAALARALKANPNLNVTFYACSKCSNKFFRTGQNSTDVGCPECGANEVRVV